VLLDSSPLTLLVEGSKTPKINGSLMNRLSTRRKDRHRLYNRISRPSAALTSAAASSGYVAVEPIKVQFAQRHYRKSTADMNHSDKDGQASWSVQLISS